MNLGMPEILVILVVALLIFGPKKLPELGRSLGQSIREFKRGGPGDPGGAGEERGRAGGKGPRRG